MKSIISSSILILFWTFTSPHKVYGYSSGAPKGACLSMKPNHDGQEPQQGKSYHHFTIVKDGAYVYGPGDKVNISLFVPDSSFSKFKGFMIQVIKKVLIIWISCLKIRGGNWCLLELKSLTNFDMSLASNQPIWLWRSFNVEYWMWVPSCYTFANMVAYFPYDDQKKNIVQKKLSSIETFFLSFVRLKKNTIYTQL